MKLSDIDTSVYYPITIPSTKKKTKFRPFRVREERALLTAQESEDSAVMINTLESVVKSCVVGCPELTTFDVEYLFVQVRSKSVGETADIVSTCQHCGEKNHVTLNLTKVEVVGADQDKKIKLADNLIVLMKYPSIGDVAELVGHGDFASQDTKVISAAIETVYYNDTVFHTKESDTAEILEFLLNRSDEEMSKLVEFIENIPSVILETEYTCKKCSEKNMVSIKNLSDFF